MLRNGSCDGGWEATEINMELRNSEKKVKKLFKDPDQHAPTASHTILSYFGPPTLPEFLSSILNLLPFQ
jgi:hypothetical protein